MGPCGLDFVICSVEYVVFVAKNIRKLTVCVEFCSRNSYNLGITIHYCKLVTLRMGMNYPLHILLYGENLSWQMVLKDRQSVYLN